ncbi:formate/nitrite transporter family protein [Desulfonatronovibrio hydrogenovorans]|uniref:formate/nitrite transporter family protein n=1 Tax=Desulfonatronovibrio hydrogenovorans TaxID=53245 RepID=UPI001377E43A|nr:formate/nitrite transporter family protein [Desulfonatronovibrio hydrogenovorans]
MTDDQAKNDKSKLPVFGLDAYSPEEIAHRVEHVGAKKAKLPVTTTLMLGILGGGFVSLGAMYQLVVLGNPLLSQGSAAILSPIFFSMGYMLAMLAGTEVFTTNNLLVMSWASKKISSLDLIRNWSLVLLANAVGVAGVVIMFILSGQSGAHGGALIETALNISSDRLSYTPVQIFFQGVLGNLLLCTAAWVAMAGRTVTDKTLGMILPISAVYAGGFQHCTGNMFNMLLAVLAGLIKKDGVQRVDISVTEALFSLSLVASGNIVGGGVLIALVYYFIYLRKNSLKK